MVDKKNLPYLYTKRDVFYFSKHVPKDLRNYYHCDRIVMCLKTKCPSQALTLSKPIIHKLDSYWFNLRFKNTEIPLENLLVNTAQTKSSLTCYLYHFMEYRKGILWLAIHIIVTASKQLDY